MSMPEVLDSLPRRVADWAVNRSLAPNSVTGISMALGLCAAAWFSAGTRPDNIKGAAALCASYLAWRAARWLAGPSAGTVSGSAAVGAGTLAEMGGAVSDYAVLVGLAVGGYEARWSGTWELATSVVIALAVRRTAVACGGHVPGTAGEGNPLGSAIRGFLAFPVGGRVAVIVVAAPIWGAHATLLVLLEWGIIATAYVITGHGPDRVTVADGAGPARSEAGPGGQAIPVGSVVRIGSSARAELSARADSPASVDSSLTDASAPVASTVPADPAAGAEAPVPAESSVRVDPADTLAQADPLARAPVPGRPPASVPVGPVPAGPVPAGSRVPAGPPSRRAAPASVDGAAPVGSSGMSTSAALAPVASGPGQSETRLALAGSSEPTMTLDLMIARGPARPQESRPRKILESHAQATIAAYRDDGAAAVWLSRVVRGQFVPLPPAVAGLAATSFLAWLGMANLPGVLLLTPLVVMLLAAFGAGHPHDGRFDWLTPAVLVAGQFVYIAAIGFAFGVPGPVTFTLCGLIALRYINLSVRDQRNAAQRADTRLGWEGRMLVVGIGAMLNIAMVAYAALAAYVAVLVCGKVRASVLAVREGQRG